MGKQYENNVNYNHKWQVLSYNEQVNCKNPVLNLEEFISDLGEIFGMGLEYEDGLIDAKFIYENNTIKINPNEKLRSNSQYVLKLFTEDRTKYKIYFNTGM